MRPLEVAAAVANLAALILLVVPLRGDAHWLRHAAPLPLLLAAAQLLIEGPRWQMVPAYALAGAFFLVWLAMVAQAGRPPGEGSSAHRLVAGLAVGPGVLVLAASIALPALLPVFRFPAPGGPYPVGTVTYHWEEANRHEIFSADPNARRELMAQVWYPATASSSTRRAPYVPDPGALSSGFAANVHLPGFTFDYLRYVRTNAVPSAPMAADEASYPVLIFLSGINGYRQSNTFQVEELVSRGYIVVGIDQPYGAAGVVFPDGRQVIGLPRDEMQPFVQQSLEPAAPAPKLNGRPLSDGIIPYFAEDVSFTLDQLTALNATDPHGVLTGRLDLQRVGTFGVSLGAIVAGEACRSDPRLRVCLMMDAGMPADVVEAGLRQPAMWITRGADTMRLERQRNGTWAEADIEQALTSMQAVFAKSPPGSAYYLEVAGMFHVNFTDGPYLTPLGPALGFTGPIDGRRGHDIVNAYSVAFFDRHLKGRSAALLEGSARQYPEVRFERR